MTAVSDETGRVTQFFAENVDSWGALGWFNRLAKAVREQDKAVLTNDEVAIEICRNVASSSAMRLVRDYEQFVRTALSAAPVVSTSDYVHPVPDHCDRITWRGSYHHLPISAPLEPKRLCDLCDKPVPRRPAFCDEHSEYAGAAPVAQEPVACSKVFAWFNPNSSASPLCLSYQKDYLLPEAAAEYSVPLYTSPPAPAASVDAEEIKAALIAHFKSVISASAGMPFEETDVHLPEKSFDGYANAVVNLLSRAEGK